MPEPDPEPRLPLPLFALAVLKYQLCPKCNHRFERGEITQIGLCTSNLAGASHPPHFFYVATCAHCTEPCQVLFPTQGEMSVERFAAECRRGEGWMHGPWPKTDSVDPELDNIMAFPMPPNDSPYDVGPPDPPEPPESPETPETPSTPNHSRQPKRVPSIRACCPETPISEEDLAAAIRTLRAYSFRRDAPSFPRLMKKFGIDPGK